MISQRKETVILKVLTERNYRDRILKVWSY